MENLKNKIDFFEKQYFYELGRKDKLRTNIFYVSFGYFSVTFLYLLPKLISITRLLYVIAISSKGIIEQICFTLFVLSLVIFGVVVGRTFKNLYMSFFRKTSFSLKRDPYKTHIFPSSKHIDEVFHEIQTGDKYKDKSECELLYIKKVYVDSATETQKMNNFVANKLEASYRWMLGTLLVGGIPYLISLVIT